MSAKLRITLLTAGIAVLCFSITACGLPDAASIPKPSRASTSSSNVLAFITPSDTSDILGYTVYYKVYFSQTDFNSEKDESEYFDEGTYINSNDEMQPGAYIPNQRRFLRVGEAPGDANFYSAYQIENPGNSTTVYIDFDSVLNRGFFAEDSPEPIVGIEYPISTVRNTFRRGVYDETDSTDNLRSFVNDWDFDDGVDNDNFYDADLRRKTDQGLSNTTSVFALTDFLMNGDPFGDPAYVAGSEPSELLIGFVVHSYGLDVVKFQPLYSKPEFIGTVRYSPLNDFYRVNAVGR